MKGYTKFANVLNFFKATNNKKRRARVLHPFGLIIFIMVVPIWFFICSFVKWTIQEVIKDNFCIW